jgi:multiple sugar transport system permease protein
MDKRLGYYLVIPALLFIVAFSLLPVIQSLRLSFFDFQINDESKSNIYFSDHYNIRLSKQDVYYIDYRLTKQYLPAVKDEAVKSEVISFVAAMNKEHKVITSNLKSTDIVKIDEDTKAKIKQFNQTIKNNINNIIENDQDINDTLKEDILALANELDSTIITSNYVGLDNFVKAFKDERVWITTGITLIFTFVSVFFELILGLVLALVMNLSLKGKGFVRTASLIPWAIPTAVAALMWAYMYNADSGIVANLLAKINIIDNPSVILGSGSKALIAVITADIWKTTPYMALMLLAGLQTIQPSLYEASAIDGASKVQQFFKVTLPLLKPSILVALLFRTLDAFRVFDLIYVLTGGGPGGSTETISIYSYQVLKAQGRLGYGSVIVIFMALLVGLISFVYIKILGVKVAKEM